MMVEDLQLKLCYSFYYFISFILKVILKQMLSVVQGGLWHGSRKEKMEDHWLHFFIKKKQVRIL